MFSWLDKSVHICMLIDKSILVIDKNMRLCLYMLWAHFDSWPHLRRWIILADTHSFRCTTEQWKYRQLEMTCWIANLQIDHLNTKPFENATRCSILDECFSTVTCEVFYWITSTFWNQPQRKPGQFCANSQQRIDRYANRRHACNIKQNLLSLFPVFGSPPNL